MTDRNTVPVDDVKQVVDGFKQYFQRAIEINSLDPSDLKNFMEPIFKHAGYRSYKLRGLSRLHSSTAFIRHCRCLHTCPGRANVFRITVHFGESS